jgi:hypothetical protein
VSATRAAASAFTAAAIFSMLAAWSTSSSQSATEYG